MDNPCFTDALHKLWIFNLENNTVDIFKNQEGYVSDSSWKYDSMEIAYDVYCMDLIGRLKLVDVGGKEVKEIINTQSLGYEANASEPVLLLFANWVARE